MCINSFPTGTLGLSILKTVDPFSLDSELEDSETELDVDIFAEELDDEFLLDSS